MSDNESDNDLPKEVYQKRIDDFVESTNTDVALAMYYLGENKYNLKVALEKFELDDHILINGFNVPCSQIRTNNLKEFRILSWNLEGLEAKDLKKRTDSVIETINNCKANIVFLQELVEENETEIRKQLGKEFNIFTANDLGHYYCGILVRKHPDIQTRKDSFKVEKFDNTTMDRHLVSLVVEINEIAIKLMTSHLESTRDYSSLRMAQLKSAFREMKKDSDFSIFAGDLNLRDKELKQIGDLPPDICDVWEATGKRYEVRFTWDPKRNFNANQNCPNGFGQRFDRMYFYSKRPAAGKNIKPVFFGLEGLQKIKLGIRFPSDHWAIMGFFHVE